MLGRLVLVGLALVAFAGCGHDGSEGEGGSTATTSATEPTAGEPTAGESGPGIVLDEPYGACAGEQASTECIDAGAEAAQCLEREDGQGASFSVCAIACHDDGDCPPAGAGNVPPHCWGADGAAPGRCVLDCYLEAETCASGTICVDGDPPLCMWPSSTAGHPDPQSFCETACGQCGATLLLPWPGDCLAACLDDLTDCSDPELQEVFACTGGEGCPAGGLDVANCLEPLACVMGSG